MRWRAALGHEVVDTSTAETIGRVSGFVIDHDGSAAVGIIVGERVVDWADAGGVGTDAVTVTDEAMVRAPKSALEDAAVRGDSDPISKPVLTEDGVELGTVVDLDIDSGTGEIRRIIIDEDEVSGRRLLGIGSYAAIVSAGRQRPTGDLDEMTRDELYETARERDIDGRSKMNKSELVAALS